jgi:RimJ/RimL family protein N-acetyltransferase
MAAHGRLFEISELPGFIAERSGEWLGHVAYEIQGRMLEIVWIGSPRSGTGAGSALIAECVRVGLHLNLGRIWLVTTNDNVDALRFYQRRGFRLIALHPGAVAGARALKPEIPLVGSSGIPLRDELELEMPPAEWADFVKRYRWPSN